MDLRENTSRSDVFTKILEKEYDEIHENIPYKLFQFLDVDDEPSLEIICQGLQFKII